MARQIISEFRAKKLLIGPSYNGLRVFNDDGDQKALDSNQTYVVKVDQGVKRRMKQGLLFLDIHPDDISSKLHELQERGYTQFLIEPYFLHKKEDERYLSLTRVRDGIQMLYSLTGGIDIESHPESLQTILIKTPDDLPTHTDLPRTFLTQLYDTMQNNAISFIEINPLVASDDQCLPLDIACEVDDAAELLVHHAWTADDFPQTQTKTEEEQNIDMLKKKSPASFSFTPINLDGGIFMLLSGGGVSIVLADEVYNLGFGKELANYGEYSGNPNAEEVYIYTKNVLSLLLKSKAAKKTLLIGGGVANFTDIATTFTGVIRALEEVADKLRERHVTIFVRRGGPNQEEGLRLMKNFLEKENLMGAVCGPDTPLPAIVKQMVESL